MQGKILNLNKVMLNSTMTRRTSKYGSNCHFQLTNAKKQIGKSYVLTNVEFCSFPFIVNYQWAECDRHWVARTRLMQETNSKFQLATKRTSALKLFCWKQLVTYSTLSALKACKCNGTCSSINSVYWLLVV